MKLNGRAWKFDSNIDTDAIIPARYLNVTDPKELAQHCMEDENPKFIKEVKEGDVNLQNHLLDILLAVLPTVPIAQF